MKKVMLVLCGIILCAGPAWANQQCFLAKEKADAKEKMIKIIDQIEGNK